MGHSTEVHEISLVIIIVASSQIWAIDKSDIGMDDRIQWCDPKLALATVPKPAVPIPVPEKLEPEPNRKSPVPVPVWNRPVPIPVPVPIRLQNRRFRSVFRRIA
ncbi:hypothetical protein JCGZ_24229 [Jatropha curcas]|uniref:Uncharacterized protein n=1 Tax=Jatropha curcas TaxID=180498 RepID=A0A067L7W1_JATCU|nr:hypothetical protein JCGZ_24229 [Jatropha curcas]